MVFFKLVFPLIILSFCFTDQAYGQTDRVDSLLNLVENVNEDTAKYRIYGELFKMYYRRDFDKAKEYLDLEIEYANRSKLEDLIIGVKNHEGIYYSVIREDEKALAIFNELLQYYRSKNNIEKEGKILQNIASSNMGLGNYKEALESQLGALRISEKSGIKGVSLAHDYFTIANIHRNLKDIIKSNEWLAKAKVEYQSVNATEFEMQVDYTFGINYKQMDSCALAYSYFDRALQYFKDQNNMRATGMVMNGYSDCYVAENRFKEAKEIIEEVLLISDETGDKAFAMESRDKLGSILEKQGNYKLAIKEFKLALSLSQELNNDIYESRYLDFLSLCYEKLDNPKEALKYRNLFLEVYKRAQDANNASEISELEIKYETEKNEKEIELLSEKSKRDSIQKNGMMAGIFALLLLFATWFYAIRQKMSRNKAVREKLDQALIFKQKELDLKKQELTAYALQLANTNEFLENIKLDVESLEDYKDQSIEIQKIVRTIDINQNDASSWDEFRNRFQEIHKDFEKNIINQFPAITPNDLRLISLIKMNLSSREIANILNISSDGIKKARYRLRKKLNLESSESLENTILQL